MTAPRAGDIVQCCATDSAPTIIGTVGEYGGELVVWSTMRSAVARADAFTASTLAPYPHPLRGCFFVEVIGFLP